MEYIDEMKKKIRNHWFKDHIATLTKHEGVTLLDWKNPNCSMYAIKYVLIGNKLFITGNIGDAVYDLNWNATLDSFNTVDLSTFTGKASCSSRAKYTFNARLAQQQIEYYLIASCGVDSVDNLDLEHKTLYNELISATNKWTVANDFSSMGVYPIYTKTNCDWFDIEMASNISDCGNELSSEFIAYLVGIQMANMQIKAHSKELAHYDL